MALNDIPKEARPSRTYESGRMYAYGGRPWDIHADGLLIGVKKGPLHPLNRDFRKKLHATAGNHYTRWKDWWVHKLKQTPDRQKVTVLRAGNLPTGTIIHSEIEEVDDEPDGEEAVRKSVAQGLEKAHTLGMRRVVVSLEGLRAQWVTADQAEIGAVRAIADQLSREQHFNDIDEVVLVYSQKHWKTKEAARKNRAEKEVESQNPPQPVARDKNQAPAPAGSTQKAKQSTGTGVGTLSQSGAAKLAQARKDYTTSQDRSPVQELCDQTGSLALNSDEGGIPDDRSDVTWASEEGVQGNLIHLRQATLRKAELKKEPKFYDAYDQSAKVARNIEWGALEVRDGRKAHVPAVGQAEYEIPASWEQNETEVEIPVRMTLREAANFLEMPAFPRLMKDQILTANFKEAYLGVAHDAMLRRLKKAAYRYAKQNPDRVVQLDVVSGDDTEEDEDTDQTAKFEALNRSSKSGRTQRLKQRSKASSKVAFSNAPDSDDESSQNNTYGITQDVCKDIKMLKTLLPPFRQGEDPKKYLLEYYPTVRQMTKSEQARKTWMSTITGVLHLDFEESAEAMFEKYTAGDADEEDVVIDIARKQLKDNIPLAVVWQNAAPKVPAKKHHRILRKITQGFPGETEFIGLTADETPAMVKKMVAKWDKLREHFTKLKTTQQGRTGGGQYPRQESGMPPSRPSQPSNQAQTSQNKGPDRRGPIQERYQGPSGRGPPDRGQPYRGPSNQGQPYRSANKAGAEPRKPSDGYLSAEDYSKLSPDEKKALAQKRKDASGGAGK